mmetsp:Transcript_15268/g.45737  ORF Transcript_15268/g.45737 Transcript_15268/m.45737 type:complete len:228 (+) Transcript_15268:316-999(+)
MVIFARSLFDRPRWRRRANPAVDLPARPSAIDFCRRGRRNSHPKQVSIVSLAGSAPPRRPHGRRQRRRARRLDSGARIILGLRAGRDAVEPRGGLGGRTRRGRITRVARALVARPGTAPAALRGTRKRRRRFIRARARATRRGAEEPAWSRGTTPRPDRPRRRRGADAPGGASSSPDPCRDGRRRLRGGVRRRRRRAAAAKSAAAKSAAAKATAHGIRSETAGVVFE